MICKQEGKAVSRRSCKQEGEAAKQEGEAANRREKQHLSHLST